MPIENASDLEVFSLNGRHRVRVVSIYDGDTFTAMWTYAGFVMREKIRVIGYDSPEIKISLSIPKDLREKMKAAGKSAKEYLSGLIMDKSGGVVDLLVEGRDKYGRLLSKVYLQDGRSVTDLMLDARHGFEYGGGTRDKYNGADLSIYDSPCHIIPHTPPNTA